MTKKLAKIRKDREDRFFLRRMRRAQKIKKEIIKKDLIRHEQLIADPKIREKVINADTPREASNIGRDRNNIRRNIFKEIKCNVMQEGIYQKFKQNKDIRSKLIETRNEPIREMTTKESYWGIGPNLDGENHMGIILMKVRNELKMNN